MKVKLTIEIMDSRLRGNDIVDGENDIVLGGDDIVLGGNDIVVGGDDIVAGGNDIVVGGNDIVDGENDIVDGRFELTKIVIKTVLLVMVIFLTGCAAPHKRESSCLGSRELTEAVEKWNHNCGSDLSLKIYGKCRVKFKADGKNHDEKFSIKIWSHQPDKFYLQGDIFFNPKGIVFGSNEDLFWFYIKPEINSYVIGGLPVKPSRDLPALQITALADCLYLNEISDFSKWRLQKNKEFDILVKRNRKNQVRKKIYVNRCDYLPEEIQYYDGFGNVNLTVKTIRYEKLESGEFLPSEIIIRYEDEKDSFVKLDFKKIMKQQFSTRQKQVLFNPPKTAGFENVYRYIDNELIKIN
jgi:hypothetical protein